jgi:hypothetical protein
MRSDLRGEGVLWLLKKYQGLHGFLADGMDYCLPCFAVMVFIVIALVSPVLTRLRAIRRDNDCLLEATIIVYSSGFTQYFDQSRGLK